LTRYSEEIKKGIEFLYESQTVDGNYPDGVYFINRKEWDNTKGTIFTTSVITHCLSNIINQGLISDEDLVSKCRLMIKRSLDLFIHEMRKPGVWRFGVKSDRKWNRLPFDIDDTCCVSYLLKNYHPYIHFGINKDLILKNRNNEGLFYTWFGLLQEGEVNAIDAVVNANVCLYLGENIETEKALDYICKIINSGREEGTFYYYPDKIILYYMISRAFESGIKKFFQCNKMITNNLEREGISENVLHTAVSMSTLFNFGQRKGSCYSDRISSIVDLQTKDGSWDKFPFHQGGKYPQPAAIFCGSECLSTALCIESIIKYLINGKIH
jgi:hypothetical protein